MATGLVAVLGLSASVTYTAAANAKLRINAFAGNTNASISIGGVSHIIQGATMSGVQSCVIDIYMAAQTSLTIATAAYSTAIISCIEES